MNTVSITQSNPIKVLLVDEHALFREGLDRLLAGEPDFQVVGQTSEPDEAVDLAAHLLPDLVLLDLSLTYGAGLDTLRAITISSFKCAVVILTSDDSNVSLFAALRAGARGYLLKTLSYAKLLTALRALRRGEPILSRGMTTRVVEEFTRMGQPLNNEFVTLQKLTARELEILRHLSSGASNREIAAQLVISEHTVKVHVHNILDKLQLKNRSQAASISRLGVSSHDLTT